MKSKKNIIVLCLIIVAVILIGFGYYVSMNDKSNNNSLNKKEINGNKKTPKKDTNGDKKYYCYRHNEEEKEKNSIKYKYTKYYMFIVNNSIKSDGNKLVYIYKFNTKDDLNNFDINSLFDSTYEIKKDEKGMTYTVSSAITIGPKEENKQVGEYTLDMYLELLKEYGFNNCEKKD